MSKIVQTGDQQVCLVGGNDYMPSLLAYEYDVSYTCLMIDLSSGIITVKAEMRKGRYHHGVAHIGNFVYAVAGCNRFGDVRTCERFDISINTWTNISEFDEFPVGVSVLVSAKRYIMAFGGMKD